MCSRKAVGRTLEFPVVFSLLMIGPCSLLFWYLLPGRTFELASLSVLLGAFMFGSGAAAYARHSFETGGYDKEWEKYGLFAAYKIP